VYFSFPSSSAPNFSVSKNSAANATIKNTNARIAGTSEIRYGFDSDITLFGKIDYGYTRDEFDINVVNGATNSQFAFEEGYTTLDPYYGVQGKVYRDDDKVLSTEFYHYPGEYVMAEHEDYLIHQKGSVEARLLLGMPFESDINFFNILGGEGSKRWHYYDFQTALRYFYELDQMQWELDAHFGIRPADNWLFVFGMYNTFHGVSYIKKPVTAEQINYIADNTTLNATEKNNLRNALRTSMEQASTFRNHELNYKVSYELAPGKNLALECISNVLIRKPFENNTAVLSYNVKF
jgi:hypothetical protein